MQTIDGKPVFSATDLVGYLACEHLTELERAAMDQLVDRPMRVDPELDVIRRRGFQHEARYLSELEAAGKTIATIEPDAYADETPGDRLRLATQATVAAMREGADVIYQAAFFDGRWRGLADFLLKVDTRPSRFGPYHYEVADTKLARHVKASALLQICTYVDLLTPIQGVQPEWMHVALGGSARAVERLRVDDFMAYYRSTRERFEAAVGVDADPPSYPSRSTYPDPVEHCDVCRWSELCSARRRADDHLSLVAGISTRQRRALGQRGVTTLEALGDLEMPVEPPLEGTSPVALARVQDQARIQLQGRRRGALEYELLPVEAERGLATLPAPSPGDLFFDMEGDPYAFDDGLDYLFGVMDSVGAWRAFWSFDETGEVGLAGEKRAFEAFIDLVMARLEADPDLHVYHYAPYEPTAMKRLMGRHATREDEVDRLLRGGVFVDLLRAVRQGLRASVESYSIKKMEPFYGFTREIDLRDAGSSIVAFEEWLQLGEGDRPASDILERIEHYNRDDVVSTARLRDWLEELRRRAEQLFGEPVPRPGPRSPDAPVGLTEAGARVQALTEQLTADVPADPTERTGGQAARWLLAQLLSWHRREMKAAYWDFFRRMGLTPRELVPESQALGGLEPSGPLGPAAKRTPRHALRRTWRYRMPVQDHDIRSPDLYDPALQQERPDAKWSEWKIKAEILTIDYAAGTLDLSWPGETEPRHPQAIVPLDIFPDQELRAGIFRLGEWVAENALDAPGPRRAGRDLLLRRAPRCGQGEGEELRQPGEADLDAARRLVSCLDEGTLAIQGPPGSGKTYTGARMIARLLRDGRTVGISATSHKVISHFLEKVVEATADAGVELRAVQKISEDGQGHADPRVTATTDNAKVRDGLASGDYNVAAGTPWLWASERSESLVDVLFVDEAGQMALANVLAMSGATRSLVLLGDPQQLDQPLQGSHPPGAERSALAHLLGDHATMPQERGLFLETTWRLHPDICAFTSETFYDDRLLAQPDLIHQRLNGVAIVDGTGLRMLEVVHDGNDNRSPEEAAQVEAIARALVDGGTWIDRHGQERRIGWHQVLVITPYNAQVGEIGARLPEAARVGTVDKFQGQEAPISIYSMAASSPEDAPRGMGFLYSRHRLNVATSRARCVAVVVASPALLRVRARTPEQMRLANALCRFVELARERAPS